MQPEFRDAAARRRRSPICLAFSLRRHFIILLLLYDMLIAGRCSLAVNATPLLFAY